MVTVSNKLDLFTKVVIGKLDETYEASERAFDQENEEALKVYEVQMKERAKRYVEDFENEAKHEAKKIVSKARTISRGKHIVVRQELYKEFEKAVREKVIEFTEEEGYKIFLKEKIKLAVDELKKYDNIIIELTEKDYSGYKTFIDAELLANQIAVETVSYKMTTRGIIGGLIFYNGDFSVRIDNTLDATLEDRSRVISVLLSDIFEEVGDKLEK